jgi:hypothetical protein
MPHQLFVRWVPFALGAILWGCLSPAGACSSLAYGGTKEPTPGKAADAAPAGGIRGRVIDAVTGKPAASVVTIQTTKQSLRGRKEGGDCRTTRTDASGEYQFSGLPPAAYNIWADADERTCAALNSIAVVAGEIHQVADLELVEGSWLEGRVLTLRGDPLSRDPKTGDRLQIGLSGPSRPRSGTSFDSAPVDDDGRFRLRVPAGRNFPWILAPGVWDQTWRKEKFERGLDVETGRNKAVNFRVHDGTPKPPPPPRPARDPVVLAPPVAEEWDAAETIRDLGGWYRLDADRHVIEINMVYNDTTGTRFDNKYTDSDEALRIAPAFPRLKRLLLYSSQATDESLACLADLQGLDTFFIWDASAITDAGAKHLSQLKNLESIHISNSQIGDGALEALATLPKLSRMSLQQNAFTDAGLGHLADMQQLRSLWIGMSKGKITDAGLAHLSGLEELEQLDLQHSQVTDAGLEHLKGLKSLRRLLLGRAPVTDKGLDSLREALPDLNVNK